MILPNSKNILSNAQTVERTRTPDDIIRMAQPATPEQERLLLDLSQLIHNHPEFFPELTELVRSQLENGNKAASVRRSFEDLRWDRHWSMRNALVPLIGRTLLYVNCDLNGKVELISRPLDDMLGMRVSDKKLSGDYAGRLEWCDGRPLTEAPAPTPKKTVQSVRPAQGELFEVAE
jgi:hypothetical protein